MRNYREYHRRSLADRDAFWREQAALIDWQTPFTSVLDYSRPPFARWFVGGRTNLCHNAVDRHLAHARGAAGARLPVHRNGRRSAVHVPRAACRSESLRRDPGEPLRRARRSRAHLHADDSGSGVRDARLRAHRGDPFRGVRRLRGGKPGHAHRRCEAEGHDHRRCRNARRQGRSVQAPGRRGRAPRAASAAARPHRRSRARSADAAGDRPRPRLCATARAAHGREGSVRVARIERAFVHPLHVGHDRQAERRATRYRRLRGGAGGVDARHLLRGAGRNDVHDQRHRLGRRPLVHHLRPAHQRLDHDHVRGIADPARPGDLVEDRRRSRREDDVQLAHGDPRAEEAGSGVHEAARSDFAQVPVSRRRAARRADGALGVRRARRRRNRRQLLADRIRLAHPVGAARRRGYAAQVRQPVVSGRGLRRSPAARGNRRRSRCDGERRADHRAAAAAGLHDDRVGRRRTVRGDVFRDVPRQAHVLDVRLGDPRRRWLLLRAGPDRRRHQRCRPSPGHARNRGGRAGACQASRRSPWSASRIRSRGRSPSPSPW